MRLRKIEKNSALAAIAEVGLDPSEFDLSVVAADDTTILVHRPSGSKFELGKIGWQAGHISRVVVRHVIEDGPLEEQLVAVENWSLVFNAWLGALKRELETPDLWALLREQGEALRPLSQADENAPFSADEVVEIRKQLAEVKAYVRTRDLNEDQMSVFDADIDYFAEAAGRMTRRDWRNIVVGGLVSDMIAGVLPPAATRSVLMFLLHAVAHLFGLALPGLPAG